MENWESIHFWASGTDKVALGQYTQGRFMIRHSDLPSEILWHVTLGCLLSMCIFWHIMFWLLIWHTLEQKKVVLVATHKLTISRLVLTHILTYMSTYMMHSFTYVHMHPHMHQDNLTDVLTPEPTRMSVICVDMYSGKYVDMCTEMCRVWHVCGLCGIWNGTRCYCRHQRGTGCGEVSDCSFSPLVLPFSSSAARSSSSSS